MLEKILLYVSPDEKDELLELVNRKDFLSPTVLNNFNLRGYFMKEAHDDVLLEYITKI